MKYKIYVPDFIRIQLLLEVVNFPPFFLEPPLPPRAPSRKLIDSAIVCRSHRQQLKNIK
jgi:hypothetical protein